MKKRLIEEVLKIKEKERERRLISLVVLCLQIKKYILEIK